MAAMADNHLPKITNNPTPSTPSPSIPLHLSGFLSGDTIQVQVDSDNLQFSVQFNIHHKHNSENQSPFSRTIIPENQFPSPGTTTRENQTFPSSNSSSYRTPPVTTHVQSANAIEWVPTTEEFDAAKRDSVVTRLRSGVLTPVNYYPHRGSQHLVEERLSRKRCEGKRDVLERVLRRHSFPIRPCSSYNFFVMSSWDVVESSSFGEKSKRLGEMWCKLPQHQKQIFEEMALKDNARYKRQCMLLAEDEAEIQKACN